MGDGGAGKREARRNREALTRQKAEFERAQQALQKSADQNISDLEASEARLNGLITESQEQVINTLNQGTDDAVQTLNNLERDVNQQIRRTERSIIGSIGTTAALASQELRDEAIGTAGSPEAAGRSILQGLVDTGIATQEDLAEIGADTIGSITGFAEDVLQPFIEQGQRSLLQSRVLTGTATAQERQQFEEQFGPIEASPVVQARIAEEERAIGRQQQALGRRFSGLGQEEILERGSRRILGEEIGRSLQVGQNLAGLGLQAASQRSAQASSARQQLLQQLENNRARQAAIAAQKAQFQFGGAQNVANIQQQTLSDALNLGAQFSGARTGIRTGVGTGQADLIARNALGQTQGAFAANQAQSASEASLIKDIGGLAGNVLKVGIGGGFG